MTVLVALGMSGGIAALIATMVTNGIKGQRTNELRGDAEAMRRVILQRMDCAQTLGPAIVAAHSCTGGPFLLNDANGNPLSGVDGKAGSWTYRAVCDTTKKIRLELGRPAASETGYTTATTGTFNKDPLTGTPQSWRPLFAVADAITCEDVLSTTAACPGTVSPTTGPYCDSTSSDGSYKTVAGPLYRQVASPRCTPLFPTAIPPGCQGITWAAVVSCPTGYRPVSGGAYCLVPPNGGLVVHTWMTTGAQNAWYSGCCVIDCPTTAATPTTLGPWAGTPTAFSWPNGGYVNCIRAR